MDTTRIQRFRGLISRRPTAEWLMRTLMSVRTAKHTGKWPAQKCRQTLNINVVVPGWIAALTEDGTPGTGTGSGSGSGTGVSRTAETILSFAIVGAWLDGSAVTMPVSFKARARAKTKARAIAIAIKDQRSRLSDAEKQLAISVASHQLTPQRFTLRLTARELVLFQIFGREAMVTDIPSSILTAAILGLGFVTGLHGILTPPWQITEWAEPGRRLSDPSDEFLVPDEIRSLIRYVAGRGSVSTAVAAGNILVRDQNPVECVSHMLIAAWESGFGRHLIPQVEWSNRLRVYVDRLLPKFVVGSTATQRVGLCYRLTNVACG